MHETLKYESVLIKDLIAGIPSRYTIPHFQRRISWGVKAQQELITSIHRGFPIGSLLLHLLESSPTGSKYSIIDGLQRTNAIRRYQENQGAFVNDETIRDEWIAKFRVLAFRGFGSEIGSDDARAFLVDYMSQIRDFSDMQLLTFFSSLRAKFGTTLEEMSDNARLTEDSVDLLASIKEGMDISVVQLPTIVYQGERSLLPEIFEKLNTNVVRLNKFQIVAAVWKEQCKIENHEVRDQIRGYWRERLDELNGLVVENVDSSGEPDELYLFDYLVGLGRLLCERYPLLFDASWSEQIAFQIATVAHGLRLSDMSELEDRFRTTQDVNQHGIVVTVADTDPFTNALIASCELLDSVLRARLSLRLSDAEHDKFPGHAVFLVSAMVTRVLIEFFDPRDWSERRVVAQGFTPVERKQLQRWYLEDRLRRFWGNAGDSKFFNRIWLTNEESEIVGSPPLFVEETPENFIATLNAWFGLELERRDRVRVSFTSETRCVLKYFYSSKVSILEDNEEYFHLDHLVPVDWWRTFLSRLGPNYGAPFNAIGNLCLMNSADNQSKGSQLPVNWSRRRTAELSELEPIAGGRFKTRCSEWYFLVGEDKLEYPLAEEELERVQRDDSESYTLILGYLEEQSRSRWQVIVEQLRRELF